MGSPRNSDQDQPRGPRTDSYRFALERSNVGVWELDIAERVVAISPSTAPLVGMRSSASIVALDDWMLLIHPDDQRMVQSVMDTNPFSVMSKIAEQNLSVWQSFAQKPDKKN